MRILPALVLALLTFGPRAEAGLSSAALDAIAVDVKPGAALPLSLRFLDETGAPRTLAAAFESRPALVIFADYTCRTLCGPILEFAAAGLEKSGLRAGSDYRLLVIGLNPKDGVAEAAAMRSARIGTQTPVAAAATFLIGDDAAVRAATAAAGFRYVYDREHDQFAHPAAAFVVDARGRITRVLSALGLDGADLRLALVEASEGRVGSFGDRVRLLCYGFDPVRGIYTPIIMRWLTICAAAMMIVMAGGLALLALKASRKASA